MQRSPQESTALTGPASGRRSAARGELLRTIEARILASGLFLTLLTVVALGIGWLVNPEQTARFAAMAGLNLTVGRAAGMSFGYASGLHHPGVIKGVAIDVQKATEAPKMMETQSVKRGTGTKPGGSIETIGYLTARVDEIDYKTRKVTLLLPEGPALKFIVGDQVKRLNEVKKGDEVVVQYETLLSISVKKPK